MTKIKTAHLSLCLILFITFTNYQLAKIVQRIIMLLFPTSSSQLILFIVWGVIAVIPVILLKSFEEFKIQRDMIRKNIFDIFLACALVIAGLVIFVLTGITKHFQTVQSPFIFFIATPIIEELIFRGWMFTKLEKLHLHPVYSTSLLFGVHHLQYFRYIPTPFALFQVTYTFFLGLLFARLRQKSGNVYISILMHILINWATISL